MTLGIVVSNRKIFFLKIYFSPCYLDMQLTKLFQVRIQRGGQGVRTPPGKSQVIWVSIGNKQLDPPWKKLDPLGKCWTPSGTLKMIVFFEINHLTSEK